MSDLVALRGTGDKNLDKLIKLAGYVYDPVQDIFISDRDPWQRNLGYCQLYDESAALLGMIIDREPIYFDYQGKRWMIGLWKGQYDLVTGAEVGVYSSLFHVNLPGNWGGTFFKPVSDQDCLHLAFSLYKNQKLVFSREGTHWWLTGFKLGMFSEPYELSMEIAITLKDNEMLQAFLKGLAKTGYKPEEITVSGYTVRFTFAQPYTPMQATRNPETDRLIQEKNKFLCEEYRRLTDHYPGISEKFAELRLQAPEIYEKAFGLGKKNKYQELVVISSLITAILTIHLLTRQKANEVGPH